MKDLIDIKNIKVVIFDLCGVLINVAWENMDEVLQKNHVKIPMDVFRKTSEEVFQFHKYNTIEEGVDIFLERLELQNNDPLRKTQIEFLNNWGTLSKPNPGGISLLKFVKKHDLKTAVLSNAFPVKEAWKTEWDINTIDKFFFSYDTKVAKPEKQAFLNVINYFNVRPEECLMIGDSNRKDIEPAKSIGMKTLYFKKLGRAIPLSILEPVVAKGF